MQLHKQLLSQGNSEGWSVKKEQWFWVPNVSHLERIWSRDGVQFSILKIRLWDVLSWIQKYLENKSQRHSGTNFSHAQWCFLLSQHLSICDCTLLRTIFWDDITTPMFVDNSWWPKGLFKPTSRNFPNLLLTPTNNNGHRTFGFGTVTLKCILQNCAEVCGQYCQETGFLQM